MKSLSQMKVERQQNQLIGNTQVSSLFDSSSDEFLPHTTFKINGNALKNSDIFVSIMTISDEPQYVDFGLAFTVNGQEYAPEEIENMNELFKNSFVLYNCRWTDDKEQPLLRILGELLPEIDETHWERAKSSFCPLQKTYLSWRFLAFEDFLKTLGFNVKFDKRDQFVRYAKSWHPKRHQ